MTYPRRISHIIELTPYYHISWSKETEFTLFLDQPDYADRCIGFYLTLDDARLAISKYVLAHMTATAAQ